MQIHRVYIPWCIKTLLLESIDPVKSIFQALCIAMKGGFEVEGPPIKEAFAGRFSMEIQTRGLLEKKKGGKQRKKKERKLLRLGRVLTLGEITSDRREITSHAGPMSE